MKLQKVIAAVIMGSKSDFPVIKDVCDIFEEFEIPYEVTIVSAHRTPERLVTYAKTAESKGIKIIIAGAGGSAHLPGMTAAFTTIPVIGVPIYTKSLNGLDSLLSILQMPPGIPVATVAINGGKNAGLLAIAILAIKNKQLLQKLENYRRNMETEVVNTATDIEKSKGKNLPVVLTSCKKAVSR